MSAPDEQPAPPTPAKPRRSVGSRILTFLRELRRIPVTLSVLVVLLIVGTLTGTLFAPADPNDATVTALQFGLPAFQEGRWWTIYTGAVTFNDPAFYLFVGALLGVGLGLYERRVGSLRAATALVVTHTVGVVVPALLLWPLAGSDWAWAAHLADQLDAGLSAGGFGVAGAATALLNRPWRGRIRIFLTAFFIVLLLTSGLLWDLEHFAAWIAGLLIGPKLAGRGRHSAARPDLAETRVLIALLVGSFAVANVVQYAYPGIGGALGPGPDALPPARAIELVALELVIVLLTACALPRALGTVWWVALLGALAITVNTAVNEVRPRPGDAVFALLTIVALVWWRRAWPWRTDRRALLSLSVLAGIAVVYATVTAIVIGSVADGLQGEEGWLDIARQTMSRFTFTAGPLVPDSDAARAVLGWTGVIWAIIFIGWLVWALYLVPRWRPSPPVTPDHSDEAPAERA
jgi:phosphatidylglycerol lysyltransferase